MSDPSQPKLFSPAQIAALIAAKRGTTCSHTTVWRAVTRAKIEPHTTSAGGFCRYSEAQLPLIEAALERIVRRAARAGKTVPVPQPAAATGNE